MVFKGYLKDKFTQNHLLWLFLRCFAVMLQKCFGDYKMLPNFPFTRGGGTGHIFSFGWNHPLKSKIFSYKHINLLLPSPSSLSPTLSFFSPDLSVREEGDEDPAQSDETEAEMSPPKSPSTPKNVKSKNSGTVWICLSVIVFGPGVVLFRLFYIWDPFRTSCVLLLNPSPPVIKTNELAGLLSNWRECKSWQTRAA